MKTDKLEDRFFVCGIPHAVAFWGTFDQPAICQFVEMMVNGIPAQLESRGEFLYIGRTGNEETEDVKPGRVTQYSVYFTNSVFVGIVV